MSSLERGYGEGQIKMKFAVGTEVDVKDEELFFFLDIWLGVTGTSGFRHFEISVFFIFKTFDQAYQKGGP